MDNGERRTATMNHATVLTANLADNDSPSTKFFHIQPKQHPFDSINLDDDSGFCAS
jgi:hypothetical protein